MQQVIVIHGGDGYDTYEEYLDALRGSELQLSRLSTQDWKRNIGTDLGESYDVLNPRMPNPQNAKYLEWKIWFEKLIPLLDTNVIFIGHSLGGIFLAKYLSENIYPEKIKATFLIAAPYSTKEYDPYVDFNLEENLKLFEDQGGKIYIYHSQDDTVVPIDAASRYEKALPHATMKIFEDKGHFLLESFPELVTALQKI